MSVGLLGGSFNPPHQGHMHIALAAMRLYKLNAIWWLVSPQNPLKQDTNNFHQRFEMTKQSLRHPRMCASGIETRLQASRTIQSVWAIRRYFPETRFVWIAGMDSSVSFHRWEEWRRLITLVPFTFFARPSTTDGTRNDALRMYAGTKRVRYVLTGKTVRMSSTTLRRNKMIASRLKNAVK